MATHGRQSLDTRGRTAAQNLAATLTAAGLDDPDILALAAEADALRLASKLPVKTSRGGVCDDSSLDGSPHSPLIGTTPASPVKSPTVGHRSTSLSPSPGRKPAAVSTYGASSHTRKSSVNDGYRSASQTSSGGYAAASRGGSPQPGHKSTASLAGTLTRRSSLGAQQQQQLHYQQQQQQPVMPPHVVAFGSTVSPTTMPGPPTRKLSIENPAALTLEHLTRRSSLGSQNTHSVAFGSTIKPGSVSPGREPSTSTCGIARRSSLPNTGLSLSRQNSSSNVYAPASLTRRSSLGAGGMSRKNSLNAETRVAFGSGCSREVSAPVVRDTSLSGIPLNGRTDGKNSMGGGRCASASPTRGMRTPGAASSFNGAAKPACKGQSVTSPFAAAAGRPIDSPTPKIVHSTFSVDDSIKRTSSLGQRATYSSDAAAFQAAAAAAAANINRHRRTPSYTTWQAEDQGHEIAETNDYTSDAAHHPSAYDYTDSDSAAADSVCGSSAMACDPTPAALPIESAEEHQEANNSSVGYVREDYTTADSEYITYGTGEKLPVLTEEAVDKELNSSGGSGAVGGWGGLFSSGSKKAGRSGFNHNGTRGASGDGGASLTNSLKDKDSLKLHTGNSELRSSSSGSSDQSLYSNGRKSMCKSKLLCLGVPILLIVVVAAVVGGMYGSKQHGMKKAQDVMAFEITMAAPAKTADQGCAAWFGSDERVGLYRRLVSSAYADAFGVPDTDTVVNSIACGGSSVYNSNGASYTRAAMPRSARLLLSDEVEYGAGRSLQQLLPLTAPSSASTWVDITTVFSVPAPADLSRRSQILETVSSKSSGILAGPLSQFLGVQSLMVKTADPVIASADGSPGSAPVVTDEVLSPESGEISTDYALPGEWSTDMIPTDYFAADGSSTAVVGSEVVDASGTRMDIDGQGDGITVAVPDPTAAPQDSTVDSSSTKAAAVQPPTELELSTHTWNPIKKLEAYAQAPACLFSPTQLNTVTDAHGRLWSLMNDKECAFRPQTDNARIGKVPVSWDTAVICIDAPSSDNFVLDSMGKMWGWQKGKTCAFRAKYPGVAEALKPVMAAKPLSVPAKISVVWDNAPVCPFAPTKTNTATDTFGRLWSWDNNRSCAFRYSS